MLLAKADGSVDHDFHGKLFFAWPRSAVQVVQAKGKKPQFPSGFGLTYADKTAAAKARAMKLPEVSGLSGVPDPAGVFLQRGKPVGHMTLTVGPAHLGEQRAGGERPPAPTIRRRRTRVTLLGAAPVVRLPSVWKRRSISTAKPTAT